jgi:hypothetical protein
LGTAIEFKNSKSLQEKFNSQRQKWKAWVIVKLPKLSILDGEGSSWLIVVAPPKDKETLFPKHGDSAMLNICEEFEIDGVRIVPAFLPAQVIENPFAELGIERYRHLVAFRVTMPRMNEKGGAEVNLLDRFALISGSNDISKAECNNKNLTRVIIRLENIETTYKAEMLALRDLTESESDSAQLPPSLATSLFQWILDFTKAPAVYVNLFKSLPHMENPEASEILPSGLKAMFATLNSDHKKAYSGLASIPAGLHMVIGGPGAGKTHWNLLVAATAMAGEIKEKHGNRSCQRNVKILYMIDVNTPVDDIADRMVKVCQGAGLKRTIIRMRGWPFELKNSEKLKPISASAIPDFTSAFLAASRHAQASRHRAEHSGRAPSLDEAAWQHYEETKNNRHEALSESLEKLFEEGVHTAREQLALRRCVYRVYMEVLKTADFIATTPVSAAGKFASMFSPDLVFLDEAPHARELTSLIPISSFKPIAWIFSGDYRQTRPFVTRSTISESKEKGLDFNPFASQMTVSMMERADKVGALSHNLLINHRAFGDLERLASGLFYDGKMRPALVKHEDRYPSQVRFFQRYLQTIVPGRHGGEPRALIMLKSSLEQKKGKSFYNKSHQDWIMDNVVKLLNNVNFAQVANRQLAGHIIIIAPYRAATKNYQALVDKLPPHVRHRVSVRTVDTAQGHEADVVFVDLVRTKSAGFVEDPNRLDVAITRARQGEIILMHPGMMRSFTSNGSVRAKYLTEIWEYCSQRGQIAVL